MTLTPEESLATTGLLNPGNWPPSHRPSAERSPLSHIGIRAKISWAMIAPIDQTTYLNVISSGRRPRSNTQGVANTTARIRAAYYDSTMLKMVLGNSITEDHFDDRP